MTDEKSDESNTGGKEDNKPVETTSTDSSVVPTDTSSNDSLLSKATTIAERLEAAIKADSVNLDRREKLVAESLLGGTTGGRVETAPKTQDEKNQATADAFLKEEE